MKLARFGIFLLAATAVAFSIPCPLRGQEPTDTQQQPQQPQQPSDTPPKPAARTIPPVGSDNSQDQVTDDNGTTYRPDDRPLTGLQDPTAGAPEIRHSFWQPGVSYNNSIQSNGFSQGGGSSWNSTNYIQGNLTLLEAWERGQLGINYSGGGYFSTDSNISSGQAHQLGMVYEFLSQRWQLTFLDQFAYLPGSSFGFGAGSNLSFPGVSGAPGFVSPGLGNGFVPNQSVLNSFGPQYSNAFGVQANYLLSRRSSITLGAVYGILRFSDPGNIESNTLYLNAGYNYALTRKDTIGVVYRFTSYEFLGQPQAIGDHSAQLSYGRKITGRLGLQVSGGPEITTFRVASGGDTRHTGGTARVSLNYLYRHGAITASYNHGVTGGSGVFLGATTDQLQLGASRKLTRQWNGNVQIGYARNRNVISTSLPNSSLVNSGSSAAYDSVYLGGGVNRSLGRNMNFFGSYTAYIQRASATAACVIGTCGTNYTSHQITLGFNWHTRPFVLR